MSLKAFVQSTTALISSVSVFMVAIGFLAGLSENSYDSKAILIYSLTFLLSWYILGMITEAVMDSVKKILVFFGVPSFMICIIVAVTSLIV